MTSNDLWPVDPGYLRGCARLVFVRDGIGKIERQPSFVLGAVEAVCQASSPGRAILGRLLGWKDLTSRCSLLPRG